MEKFIIFGLIYGVILGFTLPNIVVYVFTKLHHSELKFVKLSASNLGEHLGKSNHNKIINGIANSSVLFHKNSSLADQLVQKVRVLCLVTTAPRNVKKAKHVKETWGKRCTILLFTSSKADDSLPAIRLSSVKGGYDFLWAKTKESFKYAYKYHRDGADWFLKADDDSYVILENLRYMLRSYKSTQPIYFGFRFKPFVKQGYMSGGAGYVLSKEALRRFIEDGLPDKNKCRPDHLGAEDLEMGKCLEKLGVLAIDTRDSHGLPRFLPFYPEKLLKPGKMDRSHWFWNWTYYPYKQGIKHCCSNHAITFHCITPSQMYSLEYLIYHKRQANSKGKYNRPFVRLDGRNIDNKTQNTYNNKFTNN